MQHIREKPAPGARIDFSHPLNKGLVGCWLMNETGQRVFDSSPYKNHGTLLDFDSPPKRGTYGIVFDGVNDYVQLSQSIIYSWSIWFNSNNLTGNHYLMSSWNKYNIATSGEYLYAAVAGGPASLDDSFGSAYGRPSVSTSITSGWHNVVITYNNTGLYMYLDGILKSSSSSYIGDGYTDYDGYSNTIQYIARSSSGSAYFSGFIDEVRIWNRALFASEIKQLYINPFDMFI